MAFRTEAKACARLALSAAVAAGCLLAQSAIYPARHEHLRHGGAGTLRIDETAISFTESGKQAKHSRTWKYDEIQELVLGEGTLRIVTYEDQRWELGRDRVYVFDHLPAEVAATWYPVFSARLDQRFVAALADPLLKPEWQLPAKLVHGSFGSQGVLLAGPDRIVYKTAQPGESRTWRLKDLDNVSSSGPFDLTLNTLQRDFHFQLKAALPESAYSELWRRINLSKGLQILTSKQGPTQ